MLLLRLIKKLSMGFDSSSPSPTVLIFLVKVIVAGCVTRLPEKSYKSRGHLSLANCYFARDRSVARARMSTLQRDELLTQSKIARRRLRRSRKRRTSIPEAEPYETKHGQDL
jgi:hypothetical protein